MELINDGADNWKQSEYDLWACLNYNETPIKFADIAQVLAVVEGERDERSWWWLLELKDGRPALLTGHCDFTGWDCVSGASAAIASAPYADWYCGSACDTFTMAHPDQPIPREVIDELARQEAEGRATTKREAVGAALFGGTDAS